MDNSALYRKLAATAEGHVLSCLPRTPGANDPSADAILSHLAPSFRINWGHSFFVSTKPGLQGEKTGEGFVSHLTGMAKALQTWRINVTNTAVDVQQRTVVVRADFHMVPKGAEEVLNDIIFWVVMDDSGEKVVKCTEFIDPAATSELATRMQAGTAK